MTALALRKLAGKNLARRLSRSLALLALSLSLRAECADYWAAEPFHGKKVRIDGGLGEWPGPFEPLDAVVQGKGAKAKGLVGYDVESLYVAVQVETAKIVRKPTPGAGQDRLTLELHFPPTRGHSARTHKIDFYPGQPGKLPAAITIDGIASSTGIAVEATTPHGFNLEAKIPWSSLKEAARIRVGLRGRLLYSDASAPGVLNGTSATSQHSGSHMPYLTLGAETGLIQSLLEPKGLKVIPDREIFGNVSGQEEPERIALYGHFLSICGPGYRNGNEFYFNELDIREAADLRRLEVIDLTGDGKGELILLKRQTAARQEYRDLLQIFEITSDGVPRQIFLAEVGLADKDGQIENKVEFKGQGQAARLIITQDKSRGFDPDAFRPPFDDGIPHALLPWDSVGARTYGYRKDSLVLLEEKPWKPKLKAKAKPTPKSSTTDRQTNAPPPSADELTSRVYASYRQAKSIKEGAPSFDFTADFAEDAQTERLVVHGKDLVIFGRGFKGGQGYTFITIGVKDAKDILSVHVQNVVHDAQAEILVHALLEARASETGNGPVVRRQVLFIYKVQAGELTRIFAAETGRELDGQRVLGGVRFVSSPSKTMIELIPARALGFTQKSYPFAEQDGPQGGLEPLLLPWGQTKSRRYVFDRGAFRPL